MNEQIEDIIVSIQGLNEKIFALLKENEALRHRVEYLEAGVLKQRESIATLRSNVYNLDTRTRGSTQYGL